MSAAISFTSVEYPLYFDGLSFEIERGAIALVITSHEEESSLLLRLMTGVSRASRGSVRILGQDIATLEEDQLHHLRRHTLGLVPPSGGLISNLKIWENLTLPLSYSQGKVSEEQAHLAFDYLKKLGFSGSVTILPAHLSLHERRIAAFVRAVLQQPEIMIYCNSLDGISGSGRKSFIDAAVEYHREIPGRATLFLTSSAAHADGLPFDTIVPLHENPPDEENHAT